VPKLVGVDEDRHRGVNVFCDNLRAYRDGKPLRNVINLETGLLSGNGIHEVRLHRVGSVARLPRLYELRRGLPRQSCLEPR
jgi:hypothetical protein